MKAPTRALVVEDVESWMFTLSRAARRAGASEVVTCSTLEEVRTALRRARFDIAILDVGLDLDDDLNADGVAALEMIRQSDGGGTRCILVTGWQGDRLNLQSEAQHKHGIEWAYMKERYDASTVIAKLSELLERASDRRLSLTTPMANLGGRVDGFKFENWLLTHVSPRGGVSTLYSAVSRLVSSAIPLVSLHPDAPMTAGPQGVAAGIYWSRSLASAVVVGLASIDEIGGDAAAASVDLDWLLPPGAEPDLVSKVQERNVLGWLWELPSLDRDDFS